MPVQVFWVPFRLVLLALHPTKVWRPYWLDFDLRDFFKIRFVVNAVPQDIAKVSKSSLHSIRRSLFFCLFKGLSLAFTVLNLAIANVLFDCLAKGRHP